MTRPSARPHPCRSARRRPRRRRRPASPAILVAVGEDAVTRQHGGAGRLTRSHAGDQDLGIGLAGELHQFGAQLLLLADAAAMASAESSRAWYQGAHDGTTPQQSPRIPQRGEVLPNFLPRRAISITVAPSREEAQAGSLP